MQPIADAVALLAGWGYTATVLGPTGGIRLADIDLPQHQKAALARVSQSSSSAQSNRNRLWAGPRLPRLSRPHLERALRLLRLLLEDLQSDLVAVEGAGGAGIGLDVDERFDDLLRSDPVVERDAELAA
jgi:hypothetical protein